MLAALGAFADACGALGPPESPITFAWPHVFKVNGGNAGLARLAAPQGAREDAVPDWIVVGIEARFTGREGEQPGTDPGRTTLLDEGFSDTDPTELTAAWARHLMAGLADWQARGFRVLAERYLARLERGPGEDGKRGLDPATGDLLLEQDGARRRFALAAAIGA